MTQTRQTADQQDMATFVLAARKRLNLTQEAFGSLYDTTKANVSAWENGRHLPSYKTLADMSRRSGVKLPDIVESDTPPAVGGVSLAQNAMQPVQRVDIGEDLGRAMSISNKFIQDSSATVDERKQGVFVMLVYDALLRGISSDDLSRLMQQLLILAKDDVKTPQKLTDDEILVLETMRSSKEKSILMLTLSKSKNQNSSFDREVG